MNPEHYRISEHLFATKTQRFLHFVLDSLFSYILILSAGTTLVLAGETFGYPSLSEWVETMTLLEIIVYSIGIIFLYYFLTEVYFARTPAKILTKTIVVKYDGTKPTIQNIFYRTWSRFIPLEWFSYLGTATIGWHDALSRTYVVHKQALLKDRVSFQNKK
ncbi:RDD family protein [Flavobacterium crassostreae]|uniref:RDD domain-containing protein n=1 Tax=Flavobacterium crassostreae TaxID=1763534 RepID=A0A1B9E4H5_9FLAO|nr:RDD family protein [Flavobacterium crassostreae]OCB76852.1 hypothetical protein LPBF_05410 [Flavobacterium crassostreae]